MDTITITDGREVALDIGLMTPKQGHMLAVAAVDLLVRSGRVRDDIAVNGPQLLQFMSELGDELAQRREDKLIEALDEAHRYIDLSDSELADAGETREGVLTSARIKRELADPHVHRIARAEAQRG